MNQEIMAQDLKNMSLFQLKIIPNEQSYVWFETVFMKCVDHEFLGLSLVKSPKIGPKKF